jgi:uncharacterized protein (TIGR02231 family)
MRIASSFAALVLPVSLVIFSGAQAAEIELTSRIDRVMVFPDGAGVTRLAPLDLPAGASTLMLRGLPAGLDPASLRVAGEGASAMSIGAIDVKLVPGEARPVIDTALEDKIRNLREERDTVAGRIAAFETKKAAIERYAQASPERLGNDGKPMDVSQWSVAWDALGGALTKVNEDIRSNRARIRDLEAEIVVQERARPRPQGVGAPRHDVAIAVEAGVASKGRIEISYRVSGAAWRAVYDARLETGAVGSKPVLELVRRAQVNQRTGEDWTGVILTVSTVKAARGTAAPELPPLQVAFVDQFLAEQQALRRADSALRMEVRGRLEDKAKSAAAPGSLVAAAPAPEPVQAIEQEAVAEAGAYQASFTVPGRVDVPRDGSTKTLRLGARKIEPTLAVKTAPALDETAYLEAGFTHDEDIAIMPGEVALHRDGSFIGKGQLGLVAPGDKISLGFGADDRIKVSRVPVRRQESDGTFLNSSRTDLRDFKISVKNLHGFAMKVTVLDRIPYSETTTLVVEQLPQTTPPTEKQVADKRGVMAWSYEMAPGADKDIRVAYRVRWPADKDISFQPQPRAAAQR